MGMAAPIYYTADMVRALPDDGTRYETVHGELLVTPAPRLDHQYAVTQLVLQLGPYLARHAVGQVLTSPADIAWAPDVLVQPDVFVVAIDEARTFDWRRNQDAATGRRGLEPVHGPLRPLHEAAGVSGVWCTLVLAAGYRRPRRRGLDPGRDRPDHRARAAGVAADAGRGAARHPLGGDPAPAA